MCGSRLFIFVRIVWMKFTKTRLYMAISNIVCGFVRLIRNPINAIQKLKTFILPSHVRKVLVYDTEEGETTRCFIEALKRQLGVFELQDFHAASDEEKDTLSIIAVVRHTSIRMAEILREVKEQFDKENVKDLKRVFVACIYGNRRDEPYFEMIEEISETGQDNFATILPIDFIDKCLVWNFASYLRIYWKIFLKPTNAATLRKLERCILISRKVTKKRLVNVYVDVNSPLVKEFIAELRQKISSSIYLQDVMPLEVINETSPTLICTTGDVKDCQEKLKEKDLKEVFFCHIIDIENVSSKIGKHNSADDRDEEERNPSSASPAGAGNNTTQNAKNMPWKMSEILYYNGKFKFDLDFIKQFETFVRTCSEEIKPPSG
ncbi:uncharacterized protein LOC132756217 [Ruditapes philippinarum]|uniref:uncharacterized protein LOC132756217 n=1 Tax=Ruditapes philippinarum TaxID=129788 RepID=UPI00295B38E0|nr:uncharacterized protein LOC132756217 [Ruditapes philippinarum]